MIPLAIIVAGALVAGGIFFGGTRDSSPRQEPIAQASLASINNAPVSGEDYILGNPNADIFIIEYSDTECPFCKQFHNTLHQLITNIGNDGKVAWVYRHFPIDQLHKFARKQAEASECAAEQKGTQGFWTYIDEVYKVTTSNDGLNPTQLPIIAERLGFDVAEFNTCLNTGRMAGKVQDDYLDAQAAGGRGTPYSVFVSKNKLGDEVTEFVALANARFNTRPGEELVNISEDKMKVSVSGALPIDFINDLLAVMQK